MIDLPQEFPAGNSVMPTLTVVIPTLNASRYLGGCLASIRDQDYDQQRIDVLVADGGSTDDTRAIAESFGAKVIDNPARTAEAGKAIAARMATGDLLVFVDSDNELISFDWLTRMVKPLSDARIVASEALYWDTESTKLSLIDRYCALTGINDPLCLFVGNYGRYSYMTKRWTGLPIDTIEHKDYLAVSLPVGRMLPTMGANGFIIRREALVGALQGDHLFDIDLVFDLAQSGNVTIARVPVSIAHFYASNWHDYVKKTQRRTHDFFYYSRTGQRTYPWRKSTVSGVAGFCLCSVLVVPTVLQAFRGFVHKPDRAWFFHPVACLITLTVYATETLRALVGWRRLYDRSGWRQ